MTQQEFQFEVTPSTPVGPDKPAAKPGHSKETRREAYDAVQPRTTTDKQRIMQLLTLEKYYHKGLTRDEIAVLLDMQLASVCARCNELLSALPDGRPSLIYESVLRRRTRTGASGVVLCAR